MPLAFGELATGERYGVCERQLKSSCVYDSFDCEREGRFNHIRFLFAINNSSNLGGSEHQNLG
jgi:hypothetical protein